MQKSGSHNYWIKLKVKEKRHSERRMKSIGVDKIKTGFRKEMDIALTTQPGFSDLA